MGRPRKPIEHHFQRGTYRPSRHGAIPAPTVGPRTPPTKPRGLSKSASKLWDKLVVDLADILRPVDGIMLEVLCRGWVMMERVEREVEAREVGHPDHHRLLRSLARVAGQVLPLADKFGLTPAGRRKLGIVDPAPVVQRVPTRPRTRLDMSGPPPGFEGPDGN